MKGKSWSSNVGGRVVVSIWNSQYCQMLIGPPAGNELNRLGSGYFTGMLAAAPKQPEGILLGQPQQEQEWLPEYCQVSTGYTHKCLWRCWNHIWISSAKVQKGLRVRTLQLLLLHKENGALLQKVKHCKSGKFSSKGHMLFCLWWAPT